MRLCFVLGTAAELIKVVPVIREAQARRWSWFALSSGQSPVGLRRQWTDFGLPLEKLETALDSKEDLSTSGQALAWFWRAWWASPSLPADYVLVHGDTLSTLAGARWGKKAGVPVVHIEAGLRSKSLFSPFPEEINRRMVSRRARLHMAPDEWAEANLRRAGFSRGVINTGCNTLADTVRAILGERAGTVPQNYAVVNVHRFENLNSASKWKFIERTLLKAADQTELRIVMHPPTEKKVSENAEWRRQLEAKGAKFLPRQPFSTFIRDLAAASFVISDGGSNQEECFYMGKACLLLRGETERREGLDGCCVLAKFDETVVDRFLANPSEYSRSSAFPKLSPSRIICDELQRAFQ